jgi:hypothetical protein
MNVEKEKIIGPRAHERESGLAPEDVRLADGRPLWHVFLKDPEVPVLSLREERGARQSLLRLAADNPEAVLACQGKTLAEAKKILSAETEVR